MCRAMLFAALFAKLGAHETLMRAGRQDASLAALTAFFSISTAFSKYSSIHGLSPASVVPLL
jgi:hypothetical protein